jgi:hypothetical protein
VDKDFTYDLLVLIGRLDDEHDEWTYARQELDRYPDTIFFSIRG